MHASRRAPRVITRAAGLLALTAAVFGAAAATASASAPSVSTGGATKVSPQSATLNGTINPKGKATVYFFQYGPTAAYGSQTPEIAGGSGTSSVAASADVIGLAPATTYHYRLVARNADGTTTAGDRSFKTANQPLGFTLSATPNPVPYGSGVTLQGVLSGTGNAGRQVILQQKVFPYLTDFQTVGNPQVTGSSGAFAFPLLGVTTNTQYRVETVASKPVVSEIVTLGVAVRLTTRVSSHRVRRGGHITFSGTIRPAKVGALFAVQKLNGSGTWVTVGGGVARGGGSTFTRYAKRVKIRRGGTFRVFVGVADGQQVSNAGTAVRISTH
ncbi:MAG TPA: hypothetical protein VMT10_01325 [Solirubrobacteraceae bacterium]|nr:hypothetical protein [Solirubrobacteraceae bacterium]